MGTNFRDWLNSYKDYTKRMSIPDRELPSLPDHLHRLAGAGPADRQDLHVQASEWYEAHGQQAQAVEHALAGQAWARAAYLADQQADKLLYLGRTAGLEAWLARLPDQELRTWPRLQIVQAQLCLWDERLQQAGKLLEQISVRLRHAGRRAELHLPGSDLAGGGRQEIQGQLDTVRAGLALQAGRIELALELGRAAQQALPLSRPVWRGLAVSCLGRALEAAGDLDQACGAYAQARSEAGQAESLLAERDLRPGSLEQTRPGLVVRFGLQQLDCLLALGRVQAGLQACQELLGQVLANPAVAPAQAAALYIRWALLLAERGRGDEALAAVLQAQALAGSTASTQAQVAQARARVHLARHEYPAARQALAAIPTNWEQPHLTLDNLRIDIELGAGHPGAARQIFADLGLDPAGDLADEPDGLQRSAARLLLAQGQAGLARQRLAALHARERRRAGELAGMETLILLALACQALADEQASLDALSQALFLAAPQNWVGPFLRYGQPLARLLYRAAAQDIQPDFINLLLDRLLVE